MRKLISLLIAVLLLAVQPAQAVVMVGFGAGGESTWIETFEATGYVNAVWTETGTPNEDYTTAPLVGSQSVLMAYSDVVQSSDLGAFTKARFVIKFPSLDQSTFAFFFGLRESTATTAVVALSVSSTDTVKILCGTRESTSSGTLTAGTQYVMWLDYTKGTGSNAVASLYVAEDSGNDGVETKPGTAFVSVTNGTSTADAATFRLLHASANMGASLIIDNVEIIE